jgi:hypothetical protein
MIIVKCIKQVYKYIYKLQLFFISNINNSII